MTVLESKVEGRPPSPEDKEEVRGIGFLRTNTFHFLHNTLFSFILQFDPWGGGGFILFYIFTLPPPPPPKDPWKILYDKFSQIFFLGLIL